jgi:hypothetical protein
MTIRTGDLAKIDTGGFSDSDGTTCIVLRHDTFLDGMWKVMTPDGECRWYKLSNLRRFHV